MFIFVCAERVALRKKITEVKSKREEEFVTWYCWIHCLLLLLLGVHLCGECWSSPSRGPLTH